MPGPITIHDTELAVKDPADSAVYLFDWNTEHLAIGVSIVAPVVFTIVEQTPIPAWDSLTDYFAGDRVVELGVIYTCILNHSGYTPPNVTYWAVSGTSVALTTDSQVIVAGNRTTQLRLIGGTAGQQYRIDNKITTNETPPQIKERSFFVFVQDR